MMSKKYMALWIGVVMILLPPLHLTAQMEVSGGQLIGFVYKTDKTTPLQDARVILIKLSDQSRYESETTDEKGDYRITGLPAGTYNVYLEVKDKKYKIKKLDFIVKIQKNKMSFLSFAVNKRLTPFILKPQGIALILGGSALAYGVGTALFVPEDDTASPTVR